MTTRCPASSWFNLTHIFFLLLRARICGLGIFRSVSRVFLLILVQIKTVYYYCKPLMHKLFSLQTRTQAQHLLIYSLRPFGQTEGQKERYHHKDFTKTEQFRAHMKFRKDVFETKKPLIPLSKLAHADPQSVRGLKRRPFMLTGRQFNPKALKQVNSAVSKQASAVVQDIWNKEGGSLRDKFFLLDHTAEVLENYRRIQENEIFERVLFEERERKAFIKKEGRKMENLIDGYEQRFGNHKYLENTNTAEADYSQLHGSKHLFIEETMIAKGMVKQGRLTGSDPKQLTGQVTMLNEHKEYQHKQKELQNRRIDKLLTPRTSNPALQKYLQDKANYDTASLGETSADELALKSSGEESGIDILKPNKISESFDSEQRLAADVASYEKQRIEIGEIVLYPYQETSEAKFSKQRYPPQVISSTLQLKRIMNLDSAVVSLIQEHLSESTKDRTNYHMQISSVPRVSLAMKNKQSTNITTQMSTGRRASIEARSPSTTCPSLKTLTTSSTT